MVDNIKYVYDVKINAGAELLKSNVISKSLPSCGEMLIVSKFFDTVESCDAKLSSFLSMLSKAESTAGDKNHVIVTKRNPLLFSEVKSNPEENWDTLTVLRAYVADADQLKVSVLHFNIFAQIRSIESPIARLH